MSFPRSTRRGLVSTAAALSLSLLAAGTVIGVVHHRAQVAPPASMAPAASAGLSPSERSQLLRLYNDLMPAPSGDQLQLATYQEYQIESGSPSGIKQIVVRNLCGDVLVVHTPKPEVAVVAGKVAAAGNYDQARDYARKINYAVRRDGDRIGVQLAQPAEPPSGVWGSVRCLVLAPQEVRVAILGGPAPKGP